MILDGAAFHGVQQAVKPVVESIAYMLTGVAAHDLFPPLCRNNSASF